MMMIMLILMSMILISKLICLCIVDDNNYDAYCHKLMIRTVSFIPILFMILMHFLDIDDEMMMMMMMNYHFKNYLFSEEEVIEYVPQYVTALTMIYSPNVNGTHYPLGTASTCITERCGNQ